MRSVFLLVLLLPVALTIKCLIGFDNNVDEGDCKGTAKGSGFCYKASQEMPGGHIHKDCGYGQCESEGCKNGTTLCCCSTGDYCNGAAGSSLMMTALAATAAAWLRLAVTHFDRSVGMRSLLFFALLLPLAASIRCYVGYNTDYIDAACTVLDNFCFKLDPNKDGYTEKGCGIKWGCLYEGCSGSLCCCSGDFCNGAAGSSLVAAALVAAAAAWLRI